MKIFYTQIKITLFLLVPFCASVIAQDAAQSFNKANGYYQKNECAQALAAYEQISNKGAATWYNMGNCAYQLNDQIHALLYWKRAYAQGDSTIKKDAQHNLQLLTSAPANSYNLYQRINPLVMQILFFCIFGIFLIVAYFLIQARRWILLAMCVSVLGTTAHITHQVYAAAQQALVMHDETALRAGPGAEYHQIRTIPIGVTVQIIKHAHDWSQILVDGTRGWIENRQIEKI